MKFNPLIPVGSEINVEKSKIKNVLPKKILDQLPQTINGVVIDYKMTDGMSIGYVLMTENKLKIWIFTSELDEETKNKYKIEETNNSINLVAKSLLSAINDIDYRIDGNRSIKTIVNPVNLISWLLFTVKDIF
mgnify:CR=1 FL=1|tara:strand:+ start:546 stop:944 length:399 start_codon:yes stop_codon:yes gene_type:complete